MLYQVLQEGEVPVRWFSASKMFSTKCKVRQHFYPNAVQTFDKLILAKNLRNCTKGESFFAFHHNLPAGLVSRPLSWSSYSLPRKLSRSTQFQFLQEEIRWDPCCKWNHQVGYLTSFAIKVLKNRFLWSSKQYFQSSPKRIHKHTWFPLSHDKKNKLFVIQQIIIAMIFLKTCIISTKLT